MQAVEPRIDARAQRVLTVQNAVKTRSSFGGTAPKNVRAQAKRWLRNLGAT